MLIFGEARCPGISRHALLERGCRRACRWAVPWRVGCCWGDGRCFLGWGAKPSPPAWRVSPRVTSASLPRQSSPPMRLARTWLPKFCCLGLLPAVALVGGSCRDKKNCKVVFSPDELKKRLTPLQYQVTQEKGTESAFEGEYTYNKAHGIYKCVVCGTPLFKSETKFDSSSGWPSFYDVIGSDRITFTDDYSYGMHRVETSCSQCGAHLGHIFEDGPRPTGKRYCINSASLVFEPTDKNNVGEGSISPASVQRNKTEL